MVSRFALLVLCATTSLMVSNASAAVVYTEVSGLTELSGDSAAPTDLGLFMPGVNSVTGRVTAIASGFSGTADIFTFEIGAGSQLNAIVLGEDFSSSSNGMFMALSLGSTFPISPQALNNTNPYPDLSVILGGAVVGKSAIPANDDVGKDVLDNMQSAGIRGDGSIFTIPLGPGHYSVYLQETGAFTNYSLAFNVSAVPEPTTWIAMATFGIGFVMRSRRKARC